MDPHGVHPPIYSPRSLPEVDLPPAYGADEGSSAMPNTRELHAVFDSTVPRTLPIQNKDIAPFVLPSDLRAHILLLRAFLNLREEVCIENGRKGFRTHLDADELWKVFLCKAVHRFQSWAQGTLTYTDTDLMRTADGCPPLDVAMVWHTYMLNPRIYWEDCLLYHKGLLKLGSFPLHLLASLIDPETGLSYPPSSRRQVSFISRTGQQFAYQSTTSYEDSLMVNCPSCSYPNSVRWVTETSTGYAQSDFQHTCSQHMCGVVFRHESMAVRRFCEDVELCILQPEGHFLAGTLVDHLDGTPQPQLARELTTLMLGINPALTVLPPEVLGAQLEWSFSGLLHYCQNAYAQDPMRVTNTPPVINRIFRSYRVSGPFSIDLTSAVIRQMSFADKLHQLGWTESGRFDEDSTTLTRCVIRYHAFLDFLADSIGKFAIPTLDIDLAWHTHQLLAESYRKLHGLIGLIPDHDDKVEKGAIANAFDGTSKEWKARFGVPYSLCGCLPPVVEQPGNSSLLPSLLKKGKIKATSPPPLQNPRPDLLSLTDADSVSMHVSEHNSITVQDSKRRYIENGSQRQAEMASRVKGLEKNLARGKGDGWSSLLLDRTCSMHQDGEISCQIMAGDPKIGECTTGLPGWHGMCRSDHYVRRSGLKDAIMYAKGVHPHQRRMDGYGLAAGYYGMVNVAPIGGGGTILSAIKGQRSKGSGS